MLPERLRDPRHVALVLADKAPFARVYIPEPWRARVKAGQEFTIAIDGREQLFTGQLRWISNDPSFTPYYALNKTDRARLVYLAEIDLLDAEDLPSGMPVEVHLSH